MTTTEPAPVTTVLIGNEKLAVATTDAQMADTIRSQVHECAMAYVKHRMENIWTTVYEQYQMLGGIKALCSVLATRSAHVAHLRSQYSVGQEPTSDDEAVYAQVQELIPQMTRQLTKAAISHAEVCFEMTRTQSSF